MAVLSCALLFGAPAAAAAPSSNPSVVPADGRLNTANYSGHGHLGGLAGDQRRPGAHAGPSLRALHPRGHRSRAERLSDQPGAHPRCGAALGRHVAPALRVLPRRRAPRRQRFERLGLVRGERPERHPRRRPGAQPRILLPELRPVDPAPRPSVPCRPLPRPEPARRSAPRRPGRPRWRCPTRPTASPASPRSRCRARPSASSHPRPRRCRPTPTKRCSRSCSTQSSPTTRATRRARATTWARPRRCRPACSPSPRPVASAVPATLSDAGDTTGKGNSDDGLFDATYSFLVPATLSTGTLEVAAGSFTGAEFTLYTAESGTTTLEVAAPASLALSFPRTGDRGRPAHPAVGRPARSADRRCAGLARAGGFGRHAWLPDLGGDRHPARRCRRSPARSSAGGRSGHPRGRCTLERRCDPPSACTQCHAPVSITQCRYRSMHPVSMHQADSGSIPGSRAPASRAPPDVSRCGRAGGTGREVPGPDATSDATGHRRRGSPNPVVADSAAESAPEQGGELRRPPPLRRVLRELQSHSRGDPDLPALPRRPPPERGPDRPRHVALRALPGRGDPQDHPEQRLGAAQLDRRRAPARRRRGRGLPRRGHRHGLGRHRAPEPRSTDRRSRNRPGACAARPSSSSGVFPSRASAATATTGSNTRTSSPPSP